MAEFHYSQTIFSAVHSNCAYHFETNDVLKLYMKLYTRFWSLLNSNCTHDILISVSPNFFYPN